MDRALPILIARLLLIFCFLALFQFLNLIFVLFNELFH